METSTLKTMHIDYLHFEHQIWNNEVKFYTDELKIYQKLLEEITLKNTSTDVRRQIEHFQNQFIIQNEQLDLLKHDIKIHDNWLASYAKANPVAVDHQAFADHGMLRDRVVSFQKIYTDLKAEFLHFLTQNM